MWEPNHLLSGNQHYNNRQYIKSLKHFQQGLEESTQQHEQLVYSTLIAINKMQLANYNEAAIILNQARSKLTLLQSHKNSNKIDYSIIKIKILTNIMIIMLLNCNEEMYNVFNEIIEIVQEKWQHNPKAASTIFRLILSSLFGHENFYNMEEQLSKMVAQVKKCQSVSFKNGKQVRLQLNISPILLSSFSIYCHLAGNYVDAIKLQQTSYEISKNNNFVASVLSLKHLQELSFITKNEKSQNKYKNELKQKMKEDEFQGVAEQTLFRNYRLKIAHASKIIRQLIQIQKEFSSEENPIQDNFVKMSVLARLKRINKQEYSQQIASAIEIIRNSQDNILNLLPDSQFITVSVKEYQNNICQFLNIASKVRTKNIFNQFLEKLRKDLHKNQTKGRVINIDFIKEKNGYNHQPRNFSPKTQISKNKPKNNNFHSRINNNNEDDNREIQKLQQSLKSSKISLFNQNQTYLKPKEDRKPYQIAKNNNLQKKQQSKYVQATQKVKNSHRTERPSNKESTLYRNEKINYRTQQSQQGQRRADVKEVESPINQFFKPQTTYTRTQSRDLQQGLPMKPKINPSELIKQQQRERERQKQIEIEQQIERQNERERQIQQQRQRERERQIEQQRERQRLIEQQRERQIEQQRQRERQRRINRNGEEIQIIQRPTINQSNIHINLDHPRINNPINASNIQTGLSKINLHKRQKQLTSSLKKFISFCLLGQYIEKRHFSSDGGAQRFLKLTKTSNKYIIQWGEDQDSLKSSYNMEDVKGIVYGKVTQTMIKQGNKNIEPWKCFSIITKKRSFDVYCPEEKDINFWLPGLSLHLKDLNYSNKKYKYLSPPSLNKIEKVAHNKVHFGQNLMVRYYSLGRVLWKRFLLRLQNQFLIHKKKDKKHSHNIYRNSNSYAIILAAIKKLNYKPQNKKLQIKFNK